MRSSLATSNRQREHSARCAASTAASASAASRQRSSSASHRRRGGGSSSPQVLDRLAQLLVSEAHPRFHRAHRDGEPLGDLAVRQSLEEGERTTSCCSGGSRARALDPSALLDGGHGLVRQRIARGLRLLEAWGQFLPGRFAGGDRCAGCARSCRSRSTHCPSRPNKGGLCTDREQRFLLELLGARVRALAHHERLDAGRVGLEETAEGLTAPLRSATRRRSAKDLGSAMLSARRPVRILEPSGTIAELVSDDRFTRRSANGSVAAGCAKSPLRRTRQALHLAIDPFTGARPRGGGEANGFRDAARGRRPARRARDRRAARALARHRHGGGSAIRRRRHPRPHGVRHVFSDSEAKEILHIAEPASVLLLFIGLEGGRSGCPPCARPFGLGGAQLA